MNENNFLSRVKKEYSNSGENHCLFLYNCLNKVENCSSEILKEKYNHVIILLGQWYFIKEIDFCSSNKYQEYLNLKKEILSLEEQIEINNSRNYSTRTQLNEDIYGDL